MSTNKRPRKTSGLRTLSQCIEEQAHATLAVLNLLDGSPGTLGIVLNASGGKDSQAMIDYVIELLRTRGKDASWIRQHVVIISANLGRAEWDVKDHLQQTADHYGLDWREVFPPRDLITSIRRRGMWPSMKARYCTSDHKRGPLQKAIRALAKERGWSVVVDCTGERAEESPRRRKAAAWEREDVLCTRVRTVFRWRPVLFAAEAVVWSRIEASGLPAHPIYALGMRRLSCRICVFASLHDLRTAKRLVPELFAEYVAMEAEMGHTFRHGFRLADLDTAEDDGLMGPP